MQEFTDRVVLISGATRGIGKAIARNFLQAGAQVIGIYAGNNNAAKIFTDEHNEFAGRFELLQCNVGDEQQVVDLFAIIETKYHSLDILVNNAGVRRDAMEVARKNITVNCVSPGFISTDFINNLDQDLLREYKKMVPMRRFGTPDDVAHAVLFLAGEKAAYISGTVLDVNGGL